MERARILWGLGLILIGGFLLSLTLGWIPELSDSAWAVVFAIISLLLFINYFTVGFRQWGWLFPATTTGSIAAIIWLSSTTLEGEWLGALFLFSVSIPFWVAYISNRSANWWALIPGGVLLALSLIPLLLVEAFSGEMFGAVFMAAIGLVFLLVYLTRREQWWAIIPAGTTLTIGIVVALSTLQFNSTFSEAIIGGAFFAGLALTFGVLWLLRGQYDTEWAKYPGIALAAVALISLVAGTNANLAFPILLVGGGLWLLIRNLRRAN
ncbi:MAG: hypothetical protein JXB38_17245 [Anaerolineales bacterium]|nr:hypothetical protein [Anaerolineales bacterium]